MVHSPSLAPRAMPIPAHIGMVCATAASTYHAIGVARIMQAITPRRGRAWLHTTRVIARGVLQVVYSLVPCLFVDSVCDEGRGESPFQPSLSIVDKI